MTFSVSRVSCVLPLLLVCGCGTIIHGRDQKISVTTRPPGAEVYYDGAVRGVTPCQVVVSRRPLKSVLLLSKSGYQQKELVLKNGVSLWALLGNLVIGGIPGYIIDAATGSFGAYYTDTYEVDLQPAGAEATSRRAPDDQTSDWLCVRRRGRMAMNCRFGGKGTR